MNTRRFKKFERPMSRVGDALTTNSDAILRNIHSFSDRHMAHALINKDYRGKICHPTAKKYLELPGENRECSDYSSYKDECCVADDEFLRNIYKLSLHILPGTQVPSVFADVLNWASQHAGTETRDGIFHMMMLGKGGDGTNKYTKRDKSLIRFIAKTPHRGLSVCERSERFGDEIIYRFITDEWHIDENSTDLTDILREYGTTYKINHVAPPNTMVFPFPWTCSWYHSHERNPQDTNTGVDIEGLPDMILNPKFGNKEVLTEPGKKSSGGSSYSHVGFFHIGHDFKSVFVKILFAIADCRHLEAISISFRIPDQNSRSFEGFEATPQLDKDSFRTTMDEVFHLWKIRFKNAWSAWNPCDRYVKMYEDRFRPEFVIIETHFYTSITIKKEPPYIPK